MKTLGKFYSVKEVTDIFGVQSDTIYEWIYTVSLKAYKLDGIVRISEYHLKEFLQMSEIVIDDMFDFANEDVDYYPLFLDWIKQRDNE
ncbi:helix-turn-helix domain-containing protein [Metabacillus malikii]|uniref:Excisionase family DNA binding protein n=1 Tax=Metabacillus malikii TaxID=1504265 RepID=A0ABT9ZDB3_9BACI|nr:helix-turn-helix domain-containing protein [Metabacillus malikii]MDQ0230261.1 excisionase family DNA binding protein [Metabacillus malikii]